jgi:hypothetical protein
VKNRIEDEVVGWVRGCPERSFHWGKSSLRAVGSITAPERICDPAVSGQPQTLVFVQGRVRVRLTDFRSFL